MNFTKTIALIPILGLLAAPVLAERDHDRFDRRQDRQHSRIEQGVRGGELTRKETKVLRKEQRHVDRLERKFKRDGHLDRFERRTLKREYDHAGGHIRKLKHNDRYRYGRHDKRRYYDDHGHRYGKHSKRPDWRGHRHDRRAHDRRYDDNGWSLSLGLWESW